MTEHKGGDRRPKAGFMLLLVAMLAVSTALFAAPKPAQAQWAVTDAPILAQLTGDQVNRKLGDVLVESAVLAVVNGVNYFTSQLAYQLALAITSDCPGQHACWSSKAWSDNLTQAWQGAVGEAVGTMTKELFGKVICSPGKLFSLNIQLGLLNDLKPPPPKCSFDELSKSWDTIKDSMNTDAVLNSLKPTFSPGQSPVGIQLSVMDRMINYKNQVDQQTAMKALMSAAGGGGFISVQDKVSGRVKSPEAVTKEEFKKMDAQRSNKEGSDKTSQANAGSIAKGAILSVVANTMQTFLMTLLAHLWNKLVNGLLSTQELMSFQPDIILNPEDVLQPLGTTGEEQALQSHVVTAPTRDSGQYDPLLDFTSCPDNPKATNCVMDAQFANAVHLGDVTPLTIKDAIKNGMLHADWPLFPATMREKDSDVYCYTYGYCESNLKKMRAARIISIGWEIAASKNPTAKLASLGEIVSRFNDCNKDGQIDNSHPWCHLIDPDWVLKIPPTQCHAQVPGPYLESSETSSRSDTCVDAPTCLRQDDLGACTGGWGYCTRERNVWRFQGDQCPAQYNSCRTMKTRLGGVESFLVNTLDHGVCNADNVGCTSYGLQLNVGNFQNKKFCQSGPQIGKQCDGAPDCAGSPCSGSCPLDRGCTAGEASGVNGCMVDPGKTTCTATDGTACNLDSTCPGLIVSCPCYISTCRVPKAGNSCSTLVGDTQSQADDWRPAPLRFLNKNAQSCAATDNGCTAMVAFDANQSVNLVKNGGFETLDDADGDGSPDHPQAWSPFGQVPDTANGAITADSAITMSGNAIRVGPNGAGNSAACASGGCTTDSCVCKVTGGANDSFTCKTVEGQALCYVTDRVVQDGIRVKPNDTYTLSFWVRPKTAGDFNGTATMRFTKSDRSNVTLPGGAVISNMSFQDANGSPADFSTKSCDVSGGNLVFTFKNPGKTCVGGSGAGSTCTIDADCGTGGSCKPIQTSWVRASCTFVVSTTSIAHASLEIAAASATDYAYADEVQLEEGPLTPFHEQYGSADAAVDLKIPPSYLGCTGDETDRPECASFAGACRETEVGCDRYTPDDGNPSVPAIVGPQDSCPQECAGYDVFKQEETNFDTTKFPVYFIPATAKSCAAQDSGCSEFTNVETEKIEYFSGLRLCQKPTTDPQTVYYTWEGSDTAGYQLKVWNLKKDTNIDGTQAGVAGPYGLCDNGGVWGACTSPLLAAGAESDIYPNPKSCGASSPSPGKLCLVDGDCGGAPGSCAGSIAASAGVAPCTRLDENATNCASSNTLLGATCVGGTRDGFSCNMNGDCTGGGVCSGTAQTAGFCTRADIDNGDFDCREFYDADGNRHYRKLSKTIVLTDDCHQYRITTADQADCAKANGQWLADKGQCVFNADVAMSDSCSVESNQCRPYKGNASGNVRTLFDDGYEDGLDQWSGTSVTQSPESVVVGGHSMKFAAATATVIAAKEVGGTVAAGRSYTLTFWARGGGDLTVGFNDDPGAAPAATPIICSLPSACTDDAGCPCVTPTGLACTVAKTLTACGIPTHKTTPPTPPLSVNFADTDGATSAPKITLTPDWKQYSLGPVNASDPHFGLASTQFYFKRVGSSDTYIDNVVLKEVPQSIYLIRDSWQTPTSCDSTPEGTPSPQEMLGCKEYSTSSGSTVYLRSFAALCRDKAVGCRAYETTQNTPKNPYEESFNAVCSLHDSSGNPRFCGRCTLATVCTSAAGCACDQGTWGDVTPVHVACTVAKDAKYCNVAADQGPNCTCDYDVNHNWLAQDVTPELADICRVTIGESECRFKYDGWDDASPDATHPDRVNIQADDRVYLVATPSNVCAETAIGCKNVAAPQATYEGTCTMPLDNASGTPIKCDSGAPGWNADANHPSTCVCGPVRNATCIVTKGATTCTLAFEKGLTGSWKATALRDDPSQYATTLCTEPALACEQFTTSDGTFYFKEPYSHVCEFKEGIAINGEARYGWFRKSSTGADIPCYEELLKNGEDYDIYKNADRTCELPAGTVCSSSTTGWDAASQTCPCTLPPSTAQICRVFKGNTTCGFQGWAGVCPAQYDRCEEYLDPAATSVTNPAGQPYYYIDNSKLDKSSCGGQASLSAGCVMFKKTSDPANLFASFSTYYRSSTVFNGGKVTPDNCDLDPRSPDCDRRCFAVANGACKKPDSSGSQQFCYQNADCPSGESCVGSPYFGQGCKTDTDCDASRGELCQSEAGVAIGDRVFTKNDANIIIKVRRDRECAEWLACTESESVWVPQLGKYKDVCSGFDACRQNRKIGESEECGQWADRTGLVCVGGSKDGVECKDSSECGGGTCTSEVKRVTADLYAQRDITYKGLEYSGYSLYGDYPEQYFTTVDYRQGLCTNKSTGAVTTKYCWVDGQCANGERCGKKLLGFCQVTTIAGTYPGPKPCNSNGDCGADDICVTSEMATQKIGVVLNANLQCYKDSDCVNDAGCSGTFDCPGGSQGAGRCIQNLCIYDIKGGGLRAGVQNAPTCRGYPESDAPFPTTAANDFDGTTGLPTDVKTGFSGANICAKNNFCECSYARVGYGPSGVVERFVSQSNPQYAPFGNDPSDKFKGVCTGGPQQGSPCDPKIEKTADVCGKDDGGQCTPLTKNVRATGWLGFCLDPDLGRNINGDPNQYACNLWLPVDQLAGSADIYNLYQEAGYNNPENVLYCQNGQGNKATVAPPGGVSVNPYSLMIASQWEDAGGGDRGPGWGWWYNAGTNGSKSYGRSCDFAASGCDEMQARTLNYPADMGRAGLPNDIFEDMVTGIHVFMNAGFSRWSAGDSRAHKLDFYLTSGNGYKMAITYKDNSNTDVPDPRTYFGIGDTTDDGKVVDPSICQWGKSADSDSDCIGDDHLLCTRANFDGTTHRLTSFDTLSCNDDDRCQALTDGEIAALCTLGGIGGCIAAGISTAAASNGCPNFLADVYVDMREWCQEVAYVHDPGRGGLEQRANYAWTDRLFQADKAGAYGPKPPYDGKHVSKIFQGDQAAGRDNPANKDITMAPYGAIPTHVSGAVGDTLTFNVNDLLTDDKDKDKSLHTTWNSVLPIYATEGGSPFTKIHVGLKQDGTTGEFVNNWTGTASGIPFSCYGDCGDGTFVLPGSWVKQSWPGGYAVGANDISQLFAVAWDTYFWSWGHNNRNDQFYTRSNIKAGDFPSFCSGKTDLQCMQQGFFKDVDDKVLHAPDTNAADNHGWDLREKYATEYNAPKVVGVDYSKCFGSGKACLEGGVGLTVNKVSNQDVIGYGGKLKAIISYYAYADKDHMAIREKKINFGDGSSPIDLKGWYKNHRGSKDLGNGTGQSNCDPNVWGGTSDSCINEYFQDTKTYTCAKGEPATMKTAGKICGQPGIGFPCTDTGGTSCHFRPRVQFTDNWQLCNGRCPGGAGTGNLCMTTSLADDCNNPDNTMDPWTWFPKDIVVYPGN